jgi:hypothetical protein
MSILLLAAAYGWYFRRRWRHMVTPRSLSGFVEAFSSAAMFVWIFGGLGIVTSAYNAVR